MEAGLNVQQVLDNLPLVKGGEDTYPFLMKVIKDIQAREKQKKLTLTELNRFALVMLYIDYRAANFQADEKGGFSTLRYCNSYQEDRFKFFNERFEPIESTKHYCDMLKIGLLNSLCRGLLGISTEEHFLKYILKGK